VEKACNPVAAAAAAAALCCQPVCCGPVVHTSPCTAAALHLQLLWYVVVESPTAFESLPVLASTSLITWPNTILASACALFRSVFGSLGVTGLQACWQRCPGGADSRSKEDLAHKVVFVLGATLQDTRGNRRRDQPGVHEQQTEN